VRRSGRWLRTAAFVALVAAAVLVGAMRAFVLPNADRFREPIARTATDLVGRPVTLGRIEGGWAGFRPWVSVSDVVVHDADGRPAFRLDRVEAQLGWSSLAALQLRCRALVLEHPQVVVRRDARGQISVGGVPIASDTEPSRFPEWLFSQHRVLVTGARVTWIDEQRGAPPLELKDLEFDLRNRGRVHRVRLVATPALDVGTRVDLRGEFRGQPRQDLRTWSGRAYLLAPYLNLGAARRWVELPVVLDSGAGQVEAWVETGAYGLQAATFDVRLAGATARLDEGMFPLEVPRIQGRFTWLRTADGFEAAARRVAIGMEDGRSLPAADIVVRRAAARDGRPARLQVESDLIDIGSVLHLVEALPVDNRLRQALADHRPRGRLRELAFGLESAEGRAPVYTLSTRFEGLEVAPAGQVPGVSGLSGSLTASQRGGQFRLESRRAVIQAPHWLYDAIGLDTLEARGGWTLDDDGLVVTLQDAALANADVAGRGGGSIRRTADGRVATDLSVAIARVNAAAVWRYLPRVVGESTRAWLRDAILAGTGSQGRFVLKGDLDRFPFADGSGLFEITTNLADGRLQYAPDWPRIDRIRGALRVAGHRLHIDAGGETSGARLSDVEVTIPDLSANDPVIGIRGRAGGPVADFLKFLAQSPVGDWVGHVEAGVRATGNGVLGLQIALPIRRLDDTKASGTFTFEGARLESLVHLPPLDRVRGVLEFSEKGARMQKAGAEFLGGPVRVDLAVQSNGAIRVDASGSTPVHAVRQAYPHVLLDRISGGLDWTTQVTFRGGKLDVTVDSPLVGLAVDLPPPLGKALADVLPTRVQVQTRRAGLWASASVSDRASAVVLLDGADDGFRLQRGAVEFGGPARLPDQNALTARGRLSVLDVDAWQVVLASLDTGGGEAGQAGAPLMALPLTADLRFGVVEAYGREFRDVALAAQRRAANWQINVASKDVDGVVEWYPRGRGRFTGKLARLHIPDPVEAGPAGGGDVIAGGDLPALDLQVDSFRVGTMDLGQLSLVAVPEGPTWTLRKLDLRNPDGHFTAQGGWQFDRGKPRTQMAVRLEVQDIGRMLTRLNKPKGVAGGTARLAGQVEWAGSPVRIDAPSLAGRLSLEARKGRFTQLEPGIGKLLGVLSLQALPRRVTLDFGDVFSDGFAFDDIVANSVIDRGVLRTEDFRMVGSAAKVSMKGSVDIVNETQDLDVKVIPSVTDSIAVGTAFVNPLAGLIALVLGKALGNPLDKVIAFEYALKGSWAEPVVTKPQKAPVAQQRASGHR
jgi:uncharacterized protein (TIGR02099 family)